MGIYASSTKQDFELAPAGIHNAVCVDIVDLGVIKTTFGDKHKIRIVWEIEALKENGERFTVGNMYGLSLHEKSQLRKDLRSWRGRDFTVDELKGPDGQGFDLEKIIGKCCQLYVKHEASKSDPTQIFANPKDITPAKVKLEPSGKYIRKKDRPANGPGGSSNHQQHAGNNGQTAKREEPMEEIPF